MPRTSVFEGATFQAATPDELPVPQLHSVLKDRRVARIRGLFDPAAIRASKERMVAQFTCSMDRKHDPRDTEAVRTNFQKLVVGGITGTNRHRALARFVRMFYNPIFAEDVHEMRAHFIRLARVRNRLFGLEEDFAVHGTEAGYWTASRVHQYPRGGGFMVPHRDAFSRMAVEDGGGSYLQLFLVMTTKGEDFMEGGAFVELENERVYYEDECEAGDVILYDGEAIHGVGDIDPLEPLDLTTLSGRLVAFASLYRHFTPGDESFASFARKAGLTYGKLD